MGIGNEINSFSAFVVIAVSSIRSYAVLLMNFEMKFIVITIVRSGGARATHYYSIPIDNHVLEFIYLFVHLQSPYNDAMRWASRCCKFNLRAHIRASLNPIKWPLAIRPI